MSLKQKSILPGVGSDGVKACVSPARSGGRSVRCCLLCNIKYCWRYLLCASWSVCGCEGWVYLSPHPGQSTPAISCLDRLRIVQTLKTPLFFLCFQVKQGASWGFFLTFFKDELRDLDNTVKFLEKVIFRDELKPHLRS